MARPAGTGNDHLEACRLGALGEGIEPLRGPVRRDDAFLVADTELVERFRGMPHGIPVRLASHDNCYRGGHEINSSRESRNIGRIIGSGPSAARRWQGSGNALSCLGESRQALDSQSTTEMPMKKKPRA